MTPEERGQKLAEELEQTLMREYKSNAELLEAIESAASFLDGSAAAITDDINHGRDK